MKNKILIIGGDSRQLYMADYFIENNYNVEVYGLPEKKLECVKDLKKIVANADIIILPLPLSKDGKNLFGIVPIKENIDELIKYLNNNHIVFGGMIDRGTENKIRKKTEKLYDYFKDEEVTIRNTVPTVQGILKTIIDNVEYTISGSRCAIFGYGRVAKITADTLHSLGAEVTVCARKAEDTVTAEIKGMKSCMINDFIDIADRFDIIINTVPSVILNRDILERTNGNCLIIDVASAPYGVDFAAAYELGLNAMQCPSLPGKIAPKTAGEIIGNAIIKVLKDDKYG